MSALSFRNRTEAGRCLSHKLLGYENRKDVVVLALPGGSVAVAYEVAKVLRAPLDVFLVELVGVPGQDEVPVGGVASGGVRVLDESVMDIFGLSDRSLDYVVSSEQERLEQKERFFRGNRAAPDLSGRVVIFIDDGLTPGALLRTALAAVKRRSPTKLVTAMPVPQRRTCEEFADIADELVWVELCDAEHPGGIWYRDVEKITDFQVHELLEQAARERY